MIDKKCKNCKYWDDAWNKAHEINPHNAKGYGQCEHPKIQDMIVIGYCNDWDFFEDSGCTLFEAKL